MKPDGSTPRILAIGNGWSPDQLGGLNRYFTNLYSALLQEQSQLRGVVLGPAASRPPGLLIACDRSHPLPIRLLRLFTTAETVMNQSDVVVGHFALNLACTIFLGKGKTKPVVMHFHGPWSAESRAMGQDRAKTQVKLGFEKLVYRKVDRFIVLSDSFRQILIDDYGVSKDRIAVIAPGVDLSRFQLDHARNGTQDEYAFAVRRLVPRMGLESLIRAWAKLDYRRVHLYIAGDGPLRPFLQELIDSLGLSTEVTLLGHITDVELSRLYAGALFSVVPTLELEGFGLVVLESLASGTPVIASGIEGLRDVLGKFSPHLLVPPGDIAALADLINEVLRDRDLLPSPAVCRQEAERYDWSLTAHKALQEYQEALDFHNARQVAHSDASRRSRLIAIRKKAASRLRRTMPSTTHARSTK